MVKPTIGQWLADWVTEFSGSWGFIFMFSGILLLWVLANTALVFWGYFDPYPFIFLNLILTVVSTFQGPLILMSQTRQNDHDREHMEMIMAKLEEIRSKLPVERTFTVKGMTGEEFTELLKKGVPWIPNTES